MKAFAHAGMACLVVMVTAAMSAHAQSGDNYPGSRIVTVAVPFAAGGASDKMARELVAILPRYLGGTMIVENYAGAGGTVGTRKVASAKADGYTLLVHHIGISTAPSLYRNLGFKPTEDLMPIGEIADVPMVLVGRKNLAPATMGELIPYVAAHPDKVSMANAGVGSAAHLCGLLVQSALKTQLTTVSYKGSAPALNDVLGAQVDLMCDQTTSLAGHLQARSLRTYAVMRKDRIGAFGDIPSITEAAGLNIEVNSWHGLYAPRGTSKEVLAKLNAALQKTVADPDFREKMKALGAEAVPVERATPESLRKLLSSEIARWKPIIEKAGGFAE